MNWKFCPKPLHCNPRNRISQKQQIRPEMVHWKENYVMAPALILKQIRKDPLRLRTSDPIETLNGMHPLQHWFIHTVKILVKTQRG